MSVRQAEYKRLDPSGHTLKKSRAISTSSAARDRPDQKLTQIEVLVSSSEIEAKYGFANVTVSNIGQMNSAEVDELPYGVVGLSDDGLVEVYNKAAFRLGGLSLETVMGSHFFLSVAQCMNNFMVAQRFIDEPEIDATLPFVLTFRMRPTPVTLRLLKHSGFARSYVLMQL